jgi:hypothetical protein
MMVSRTQVSLDWEMHQRARRRANELGVSLAEYLRRLVSRDLAESKLSVMWIAFSISELRAVQMLRETRLR